MKMIKSYLLAGLLLVSAAALQAQVSLVTVSSFSGWNENVQIVGSISAQNTLANITSGSSSPGFYGWTPYLGSYYTSNGEATVVAPPPGYPSFLSTTITSQYNPGLGFTSASPFGNVSGRFYIESGTTVPDDSGSHVEGGFGGTVQFKVETTSGFVLDVMGYNRLLPYGLNGASAPTIDVYGPGGRYVGSQSGEGTTDLQTLTPGTYTAYVSADVDTLSGIVVVSFNAY